MSQFNMYLDDNVQQNVDAILADYGLTMSEAFELFINQINQTGKIPLSFDGYEPLPKKRQMGTLKHDIPDNIDQLFTDEMDKKVEQLFLGK